MRQAASDADAFGSEAMFGESAALCELLHFGDDSSAGLRFGDSGGTGEIGSLSSPEFSSTTGSNMFSASITFCLLPGHRLPRLRHPRKQCRGWRIDENLQSHAGSDSRGHMSNFPVPALISPPVMSPIAHESVSVSKTSISVYIS